MKKITNRFFTFSIFFHNNIPVPVLYIKTFTTIKVHIPSFHRWQILGIIVLKFQVLKWLDCRLPSINYHSYSTIIHVLPVSEHQYYLYIYTNITVSVH